MASAFSSARADSRRVAYFEVGFRGRKDTFVIKLRDKKRINEARTLIQKKRARSVMGRIVKGKTSYNRRWSYYLKPTTVSFFDYAVEVCDASPVQLEKHLNQAGSSFLPSYRWCPWSSYLRREVRRGQ